jgi:hypothetical protein
MTHEEFVAAYREGKISVHVDPKAAARFVSARSMLPLVVLPILGLAVALALTGYLITGIALFVGALVFRYFVRATSRGFIVKQSIEDPDFYRQAVAARVLTPYSRDSS